MAILHETSASLRFFRDDLDPDEITAVLGAVPTAGRRKDSGMLRLNVERCQPANLDGQIDELLEPLSKDMAVWQKLARKYKADLRSIHGRVEMTGKAFLQKP